MFLKETKSKNHRYAQIVESYRDENGKTRHRTVANLGRVDRFESSGVLNIIRRLSELSGETKNKPDLSTMTELSRSNYGFLAYKKLWKKLKIDYILNSLTSKRNIEFDVAGTVLSMAIGKLLSSSSKLSYFNNKDNFLMLNNDMKLHQLYRTLDFLADNKDEIEMQLFERRKTLFNNALDVVFYDVTTYWFESQKNDELKEYGFSKDGKINNVQVVMGLLIDKEGIPVGYELYPGNCIDSKTLPKIIKKLKEKFQISNVIIVADKGLNSKQNLLDIKAAGLDYIVSSRIKNMSKKMTQDILDFDKYESLSDKPDNGEIYKYREIPYTNRVRVKNNETDKYEYRRLDERLICTYSSKRARKDSSDRDRLLQKAQKIVDENRKAELEARKGHKRFVKKAANNSKTEQDIKLEIDTERVENERKYDGFYAIQTSRKDLSPREIILNYRMLFRIEDSFRVLKSNMKARPVYHWTPKRIEGHFMMCFLGFLLEREMENIAKECDSESSPAKITEALNSMNVSHVRIENEKFYLKSKQLPLASKIFARLRIKMPKNITDQQSMEEYMMKY